MPGGRKVKGVVEDICLKGSVAGLITTLTITSWNYTRTICGVTGSMTWMVNMDETVRDALRRQYTYALRRSNLITIQSSGQDVT